MSKAVNFIRDKTPVVNHDRDPRLDDGQQTTGREAETEDLLTTERSLTEKITPNSGLQWVVYFAVALLGLFIVRWTWPLIPPWFTSVPFLKWIAIPAAFVVGTLLTRRKMLHRFWEEYDIVCLLIGHQVIPKVGKVDGAIGRDKAFKELKSFGFAGLRPRFKRVDDVFRTKQPLQAKQDRRDRQGNWDPAVWRLDNKYLGEGDSEVLGDVYVARGRSTDTAEKSPDFDLQTTPPAEVDPDSARELKSEVEVFRNEIQPKYEDLLEAKDDRLQEILMEEFDSPVIPLSDLPDLLEQMGYFHHQNGHRNGSNGIGPERSSPSDEVDQKVDETMKEVTE